MCALAGLIEWRAGGVEAPVLRAMAHRLRHRGPDDEGFLGWRPGSPPIVDRNAQVSSGALVGLAHRRLSIVDLSPAGWQPMLSASGRIAVVFNGEIYNYVELRAELARAGHRFRTESDTEVLLEAYERWGTKAFTRFIGMFAACFLELDAQRLLLVRDFFGIKPLYYAQNGSTFAFASEIKALRELDGVSKRADLQSVYDFLTLGFVDHCPRTFFADIRALPPAHYMEISLSHRSAAAPVRYWQLTPDAASDATPQEAADQLKALLIESVALHMRSDAPFGAALSGGLDSSAIVAAMRTILGSKRELKCFSYIAECPELSEEAYVDVAASAVAAQSFKTTPTAEHLLGKFDDVLAAQDEPFGSTSIFSQFKVFALARQHGVKVVLDGQGADELLAGYRHYYSAQVAGLLRQLRLWKAGSLLASTRRLDGITVEETAAKTCFRLLPGALKRRLVGQRCRRLSDRLFDHGCFRMAGVVEPFDGAVLTSPTLHQALAADLASDSLPGLLRYEDRNGMAQSVENRVPFLTPKIANFVFGLPDDHLLAADGTNKCVLRQAMTGLVPEAILNRRDKIGFATPETAWGAALIQSQDRSLLDALERVPVFHARRTMSYLRRAAASGEPLSRQFWRIVILQRWSAMFHVDYASD